MADHAGIWLRVSSSGQDEENQLPDCLRWIEGHGYRENARYVIHGKSAFKGNRQFDLTWANVLEDMRTGKIRVLVVWKQDRIDRKLNTFQMLKDAVDAGGRVEFVTQPHLNDLTTMGGRIALKVQEEIAHAESKDKSDRIRIKHDSLKANGSVVGKAPWGYEIAGPKGMKTFVPTELGRKYIPEIFRNVIGGASLGTIACWLEQETGLKWWARTIGMMIRNPTYMGHHVDGTGRTILRCEALVDAAIFRKAGEALDSRPKRGPVVKDNRAMLAGVLSCGDCNDRGNDSPMYRMNTGYYRCFGRGSQRKGCGTMVRVEWADELVDAMVTRDWNKQIMRKRLVPGHDHSAELEGLRFEMRQLAIRDLPWEQEDAERARLRSEFDRISRLPEVPDQVIEEPTGQTYAERWSSLAISDRAEFLKSHGIVVMLWKDGGAAIGIPPGREILGF